MKLSEKRIVKIIAAGPLVFTPLLIIITMVLTIGIYNDSLQNTVSSLEKDLITLEKRAVQARVDSFTELIEYRRSVVEADLKKRIKQRVYNARATAEEIYQKYKKSKSSVEIQKMIIDTLRPMQWNNHESYIWVIAYDGTLQLGPSDMKAHEGQSILAFKDLAGIQIIKEEIRIAKELGEGYIYDSFNKPQTSQQHQQIAFLKDFGRFQWYIGTAEFLDTAAKKRDHEFIQSLRKMSQVDHHALFVVTKKGQILLSQATPQLEGSVIYDFNNAIINETFEKTLQQMKLKDHTFISYPWKNPKTEKVETKYAYIRHIKKSDWMIGSGFYTTNIEEMVDKRSLDIYANYDSKFTSLLILSLGFLVVGLILSLLLSRYIKHSFLNYQEKLSQSNSALKSLNIDLEKKVRERTKALVALTNELQILATTDSLTKVHNRYSIMNILEIEINRVKRSAHPLSVIMVDADHFKEVNDRFGHDVGDDVLMHLSHTLQEELRDIDFIGRYGGEEFLLILPNTDYDESAYIAERLRHTIASTQFPRIQQLTISLGVTQLRKDETLHTLFKRIDTLMYKAKELGRNQVVGEKG